MIGAVGNNLWITILIILAIIVLLIFIIRR
jgi:hypothetical protein